MMDTTPPPAPTRLLILDDNAQLRTAIARWVRRSGVGVVIADNIQEAQQAVREGGVDAVLSDVMLNPGLGTDFHSWLQGEHPMLAEKMVFMTGGCPRMVQDHLDAIPNKVLLKPFDMREMLRVIGVPGDN